MVQHTIEAKMNQDKKQEDPRVWSNTTNGICDEMLKDPTGTTIHNCQLQSKHKKVEQLDGQDCQVSPTDRELVEMHKIDARNQSTTIRRTDSQIEAMRNLAKDSFNVEGEFLDLKVGERSFQVNPNTLRKAAFFREVLLEQKHYDPEAPWSDVFLDMDGDMFEHSLRYLRHGLLPEFIRNSWGDDHEFQLFERQAETLGIDGLVEDLKKKKAERLTIPGWGGFQSSDPDPDASSEATECEPVPHADEF